MTYIERFVAIVLFLLRPKQIKEILSYQKKWQTAI